MPFWLLLFHGKVRSNTLQLHLLCLVAQSCLTLCGPMDCSLPGSFVHGDSPWTRILGKNTRAGCWALLQGIFPTQGSNPDLPHRRQILYHLSHQGSPCNPMYCSKPGSSVIHYLQEFAQIHVSSANQSPHPLSSPHPPAFNLFQHQNLFQ